MKLTDHDIRQMDADYINRLSPDEMRPLAINLLNDLKVARDRLNQNAENSSIPPSKQPLWAKGSQDDDNDEAETLEDEASSLRLNEEDNDDNTKLAAADEEAKKSPIVGNEKAVSDNPKKNPGKQPGTLGHGRKLELPITDTIPHKASSCAACDKELGDDANFVATTGLHVLDIKGVDRGMMGISVTHVKHIYGETECSCGHKTETKPGRCKPEEGWTVSLTEWHLCGPMLVSLIVCMSKRLHVSRRKIQEFLNDWLGVWLSVGTINQCIHEAGRAVEPIKEELIEEIHQSDLLNIDETGWKEKAQNLWLWVFSTATVCLFLIGPRTKEMAASILNGFSGWVMTDGYSAYRHYANRLRCWAHLIRKCKGLSQSVDRAAQAFGKHGLKLFKTLEEAVYAAREGPQVINLVEKFSDQLDQFKALCFENRESSHEKTRALAREFLNDWDAIWKVLSDISLPLTNNEAERMLRHWVINRLISFGTRTHEGSQAFTILASVIETCRKRNVSPWPYIAQVIEERRKGNNAPSLPTVVASHNEF